MYTLPLHSVLLVQEKLVYPASDDVVSSINHKCIEAHYMSLFHVLPAPSMDSETSESKSWLRKTAGKFMGVNS